MIRVMAIFCVLCSIVQVAAGQDDSTFRIVKQYSGPITNFTVDNLGNVYLVNNSGQLRKVRPNGDSIAVYNNVRRFGKLHSIDVSNPLKIILFFRNFNTIVILDRFLNERSVLDLRKQNLLQVRAIGQSYDNNIWIFDELDAKLKKMTDDGRIADQSNDFRLIFDSTPSPEFIIDHEKNVYLYDPQKGVFLFDYFGGFRSRVPFTGWLDFSVIGKSLLGRDDSFLYRYDNGTLDLRKLKLPSFMNKADKITVASGLLYMLKDGAVTVYSY